MSTLAQKAPKLGKKPIYLYVNHGDFDIQCTAYVPPNFTLTLLRPPPNSSPNFASFIVPLNLNKLDLRDYLYNVYDVRVLGVRSFIQQQKVRQDKESARRPAQRRWFRPRSIKKMMVELERPFVWAEEPENYDGWDQKLYKAARRDRTQQQEDFMPDSKTKPTRERKSIAEQAKELLKGDEQWKGTPVLVWEDVGAAEEVEKDVVLPKVEN